MEKLYGACVIGQSGGPTSVINASAAGAFAAALNCEEITGVYAMDNGIVGVLNDRLFDIGKEDAAELELLRTTPASALGSCRYKLKDADKDDTDYRRILEVFKKHDIHYFFYIGGNDSMDTCNKVSKYMQSQNYPCRVIGVPKTVDNDLNATDHCPGYGSAAKYIAVTTAEIERDNKVYGLPSVVILEIMGRNAGWLTAASALAGLCGDGPDLIYLPETTFDLDNFVEKIQETVKKKSSVIVAVSEGIRDKDGRYVSEYGSDLAQQKDAFGHSQMGGLAATLASIVKDRTGLKTRGIEFSLMQRCGAHTASLADVNEAFLAGKTAVESAVAGATDMMVALRRAEGKEYVCETALVPLSDVANAEKVIPADWITEDGCGLNEKFIEYALPLISGESCPPMENGLPRFANLKREFI